MTETPTQRNRRIFDEATARGEPVFVIRAQDIYAAPAVQMYKLLVAGQKFRQDDFADALDALTEQIRAWQRSNPGEMKVPDAHVELYDNLTPVEVSAIPGPQWVDGETMTRLVAAANGFTY